VAGRRFRAAAVAAAVLVTGVPFVAEALAPGLTCGVSRTGSWEAIKVRAFQPVSGLPSEDVVSGYALDADRPQDVVVTNGVRVQRSDSHGCDWTNAYVLDPGVTGSQSFPGATSTIVSLGISEGVTMAAVQEGSGAASRPHVLRHFGGAWTTVDQGLPLQGSPRLLRMAGDGRTAYLTVSPNATGGSDTLGPTPLPTLPPLPVPLPDLEGGTTDGTTALLYRTTDAGLTWELRTNPAAVPAGGQGFTDLVVDPRLPGRLAAIAGGRLLISADGGGSFVQVAGSGWTAVAYYHGFFLAFTADGRGLLTPDGEGVLPFDAPKGITSAAARAGDSGVLVEIDGRLREIESFYYRPRISPSPTPGPVRESSLLGDVSQQASFHAISGHSLLRYVDPTPKGLRQPPPIAVGDRSVPPPRAGTVSPAEREVVLQVGKKASLDYALDLPKNPTPLDLFFLVDVSASMGGYIDDLKANIHKVVSRLERERIDLKVGVGTLGTGPAEGESPYPDSYVVTGANGTTRVERSPRIYQRIREVGDTGPRLREAINSLRIEGSPPRGPRDGQPHEGQLLALEQMVTGSGLQTEQEAEAGLRTYSAVAPGQDAGFRTNPDVRRIVVIASDEVFDAPYGTPTAPGPPGDEPVLDFRRTLRILNEARVDVFGITAGSPESVPDMVRLARGTGTVAPPGGVSCGGDPEQLLAGGAPLVCSQEGDFSAIIAEVLAGLTDLQDMELRPSAAPPVLAGVTGVGLQDLDVKQANRVGIKVDVTCVDVPPGSYAFEVDALLRKYPVGTTRTRVTCVEPQGAAIPPLPLPPVIRPPVAPAVQPPPPPPAPPPAAQPQPQPQPNVNPLTAAAAQEEQQAQLALALNGLQEEEQEPATEELAMVDRRDRQEVQALGSLLVAMTVCAGLGLAGVRARQQVSPRVNR